MTLHRRQLIVRAACACVGIVSAAHAQQPFFPGAEGFGAVPTGALPPAGWLSNATVYHVTNLNDSGPGSFRGAFVENSSNKIIVFDVAGTIQLTSDNIDIKNISNYYIAGQTAPGPVTIYGDMVQLTHSGGKQNSNIALRYLSFRKGTGDNSDAITFAGSGLGTNLMLDHVSASWSEDEILSVANNNTNVTVQYSMIHDALVNNHAYGSLIRPRIDSNVTFHHNLYANNASRQARFGTYNGNKLTADFRNNVVYNWRDRASYAGGSSESDHEYVDVNFVGNYFIAGPGTLANTTKSFIVDKNVDVRAYQSGNFVDSDKGLNPNGQPNGSDTGWSQFAFNTPLLDQTLEQMNSPFTTPNVTTQSANDAYWQVVNHVGNWWWQRDAIDSRVIQNVKTNTGPQIGASAPNAGELNGLLSAPMISRPAGWDTDNDGIPDAWEIAHGLNPNSPADAFTDFDNDGYVNVLEYINEAGAFPAPAAAVFTNAEGNNRYAKNNNWSTWQPSHFDTVKINTGQAVVDAIGQHAGTLHVGHDAGGNGALTIAAGWLKVANVARIGSESGSDGQLNLSGGVLRVGGLLRVHETGSVQFGGGAIDIEAGAVIFDERPGDDLLSEILQQVKNGRNGGTWDGAGIRSALVAANPALLGIGVARNGDLPAQWGVFAGDSVQDSSVLARVTFLGDSDLDGDVDGIDVSAWAQNFTGDLGGAGTKTWFEGDWDYDGDVDGIDVGLWAQNFTGELGGGGLSSIVVDLPNPNAEALAILRSLGITVVPEPACLALLALAALCARPRARIIVR